LNSVKDVRFARTIESSDSIELRIEAIDDGTVHVSFEAFKDDLFDVHWEKRVNQMFDLKIIIKRDILVELSWLYLIFAKLN
jgi:hypothetical protein